MNKDEMLSDHEERIRRLEIEMSALTSTINSIDSNIEKNAIKINAIDARGDAISTTMNKWNGGVTLLSKVVLLLCAVLGLTFSIVKEARSQEVAFILEQGREVYEE